MYGQSSEELGVADLFIYFSVFDTLNKLKSLVSKFLKLINLFQWDI